MSLKEIKDKINSLGGIEPINDLKNSKRIQITNKDREYKQIRQLPDLYLDFSKEFASFSFKNWVVIKLSDPFPFSNDNYITVDSFYSANDAISLGEQYEQLPEGMFPIFESDPGDLICLCMSENHFGKIYYWHHESDINNDRVFVANNLSEFIKRLEIRNEDDNDKDSPIVTKANLSEAFLNMLRKDGYRGG